MSILYSIYHKIPSLGGGKKLIINKLTRNKAGCESKLLREIYSKDYGIEIGYGTYGGCFNINNIPRGVIFGNYCSIADGVKIFRANHPLNSFTSHPMFYNPVMGVVKTDQLSRPPLYIGHDVWIGANAIILPSVKTIGNGAVIGAGSVVTKDVEPYSIVVGNPARLKKMRFNTQQIDYLESIKWWEMDMAGLAQQYNTIQNKLNNLSNGS